MVCMLCRQGINNNVVFLLYRQGKTITVVFLLYRQGKRRAQVFGLTWGISQSIFTFAYAATYGYGAYLISQGTLQFQDVFR